MDTRRVCAPESSSLMTMSSAASAFGWQRRKESDDIKPLGPEGWSFRHDRRGSGQCFELFGFARVAVGAQVRWADDCLAPGSRLTRLGARLRLLVDHDRLAEVAVQAEVGKRVFTATLMIAHPLNRDSPVFRLLFCDSTAPLFLTSLSSLSSLFRPFAAMERWNTFFCQIHEVVFER